MRRYLGIILAVAAAALTACSGQQAGSSTVNLGVRTSFNLTSDVTSVTVTISGGTIVTPIVKDLSRTSAASWSGSFTDIPAGQTLTFAATASGANGTELFSGSTTALVVQNGTTNVNIVLNDVGHNDFANDAPIFLSLFASADTLTPGAQVSLNAVVTDPNDDALTYTWTAPTGGTVIPGSVQTLDPAAFAVTTRVFQANAVWSAPADVTVATPYTVVLTISDARQATAVATYVLTVDPAAVAGSATVQVVLNNAPHVDAMTIRPVEPLSSLQTALTATATDLESPSVTYAWSMVDTAAALPGYPATPACAGSFDVTGAASVVFTPATTVAVGTACTAQVLVTDGNGGTNTGFASFVVGQPTVVFGP
jgi:hypothetical protein